MKKRNWEMGNRNWGRTYVGILLFIFGGVVLHAPVTVGLRTLFPDFDLLFKSWKEILMLAAGLIALFLMYKNRRFDILRSPIIIAIGAYALVHFLMIFFLYQGLNATLAGILIDLRYLFFFVLVYIAMQMYPHYRKLFIKVGITGALIVTVFALLQFFILPKDVLKYIGYGADTIQPYLTVDQNPDFVRINSTLRGPNPLGAYIVIVLALLVTALTKHKIKKEKYPIVVVAILSGGGLVALWASYSRSALVAALVAVFIVLAVTVFKKFSTKVWITISVIAIILSGGLYLAKDSSFISNVILHENPVNVDNISSNEGHVGSLNDGVARLITQPLGAGVGSTGSASIYTNEPLIIENQYLSIAHEVGWVGLMLFVAIYVAVSIKLWDRRRDWLALGIFASGIGLALIGLLLPVWTDDTVSIVWWGLAAIAMFQLPKDYN